MAAGAALWLGALERIFGQWHGPLDKRGPGRFGSAPACSEVPKESGPRTVSRSPRLKIASSHLHRYI